MQNTTQLRYLNLGENTCSAGSCALCVKTQATTPPIAVSVTISIIMSKKEQKRTLTYTRYKTGYYQIQPEAIIDISTASALCKRSRKVVYGTFTIAAISSSGFFLGTE